jgi:hypothetical protein
MLSPLLAFSVDRFRVTCPADTSCIRQLDASLIDNNCNDDDGDDDSVVWVAVYRSNQNQPSVFVRDEFFHAMTTATTIQEEEGLPSLASTTTTPTVDTSKLSTPMALEIPVAVAQLRPSPDFENKWILDSLRCGLKKEDINDDCDGGSEFIEALSVAVDSLLLHHLQQQRNNDFVFEATIRTKATLFSNKVLEARGFEPVEELSKDMATHISKYDACLQSYAERSASTIPPGARDRALQIVSLLGRLDRDQQLEAAASAEEEKKSKDDDQDDYDPWATFKMQI